MDFKEMLQRAKKLYFDWPEEIPCKALKQNIRITRSGWDHLVNDRRRTRDQIYFRAKHLALARKLIECVNIPQDISYEDRNQGRIYYWILQGVIESKIIEVVIRQIGNQPKHFFSLVYKGGAPRKK